MSGVIVSLPLASLFGLIFFFTSCKKDETVITQPQDTNPPTVLIQHPIAGDVLSKTDTITIAANDNRQVIKVELYINSQLAGSDATPPWTFVWNTEQFSDGSYILSAKAYDEAGNVGTSTEVTVTVLNVVSVVSLANATPYTSTVLPGSYSFNQQTSYWSVVGMRPPSTADYDLELYDDPSHTNSLASSELEAGYVDFIVSDHNHSRQGLYYVEVLQYDGNGAYTIEWESGNEELTIPGATGPINWGSATVVKVWDALLTGGTMYRLTLNMNSGTADVGIALFQSNGTTYYAGESSSVVSADINGNGQGETFTYTPPTTDYYGLVVWSNNAASASFTITTGP
jgi:hypothetical protein